MGLSNKDASECATIVDQYLMRFKETYGVKPKLDDLAGRLEKELAHRKEVDFKATFGDLTAESLEHCANMIRSIAEAEHTIFIPKEMADQIENGQIQAVQVGQEKAEEVSKPKPKKWNPLK